MPKPLTTLEVIQFEIRRHAEYCLKCAEVEKANAWAEVSCDEWSALCQAEERLKACPPSQLRDGCPFGGVP
jgi:hypothetical protein